MPALKYKDPADGQWKVAPVHSPAMTHAALGGLANDDHTDHYTPERADTVWYQKGGGGTGSTNTSNFLSGTLNINNASAAQLMLHDPGVTAILLIPSGGTLQVMFHGDGTTLKPVAAGENLNQPDTLATWATMWKNMSDRVSGPHGPRGEWQRGTGAWVGFTNGALTYPAINCPGMWKIQVTADLYVTNPSSAGSMPESFMGLAGRWVSGATFNWNNGAYCNLGRLSMLGNGITGLQTCTAIGYVPNILNDQLVAAGTVFGQGAGEAYIGGDYKHTFEFFPYATNDAAWQNGWVAN